MPHRAVSMQHFPTDHHSPFKSRIAAISMVFLLALGVTAFSQSNGLQHSAVFRLIGMFLVCFAFFPILHLAFDRWMQSRISRHIALFFQHDRAYCISTNDIGVVIGANQSAQAATKAKVGCSLTDWLCPFLPDAGSVISKMRRALLAQTFVEDIILTDDGHWRLSAWKQAQSRVLWRLDRLSLQEGDVTFPSPIPAIKVSHSGSIRELNQAARDILGAHASQLFQITGPQNMMWNAVNTLETRSGARDFFVVHRTLDTGTKIFLLPPDTENIVQPESSDFEMLPVPMIKLSVDGTIVQVNSYASQLLDIEPNQNVMIQDLLEGLGRSIPDWIEDAIQGRSINHPEFLRLARRDKEVFVQVILNRIKLGHEDGLIAVLSDATELKSLEAQFVHSQKMQAIG